MDGFLPTTALAPASASNGVLIVCVLIAVWIALSVLIQWGAARSAALGRMPAPPCFDPGTHPAWTGDAIHIAFLGDLQRGVVEVPGPLARIARDEKIDLIVSSGDFVSHGEAPYYGLLLAAFARAGGNTPIRVVPGNHDLWPRRSKDDDIGGALFEERFGPRYWQLQAGPVLVVGIDTGADWQMEAQLPWLRGVLDEHPDTPWICVSHRAPYNFDAPDHPLREDLRELAVFLEAQPPQLFISGHLHAYHDEIVNGVRYIVNAHGGDVHGLALRREDFELLHVRLDTGSPLRAEPARYQRKYSLPTGVDQLAVRMWSDRRKPLGAFLGWPAGMVLRMLGRYVPVVKHPVERRIPSKEILHERRRVIADARNSKATNP